VLLGARQLQRGLLRAALAGEVVAAREQLVARVALLLRAHRDHLRLRMDTCSHDLRLLACLVHRVARDAHPRGDVLVLLRDRVEVVDAVERILERVRLDDHLHQRRIVRLVQVDHPQVELVQRGRVGARQEVEPLGLERVQRVELVEPPLVQLEITLEQPQLLRDVAHPCLEVADVAREPADLLLQPRLLLSRGRQLRLHLAQRMPVVAGGRRREQQAADGQDRETARHEGRFGGTPDVPALA
jgi:hypothetical protein